MDNLKTDTFEHFLVDKGFITQALYDNLQKQSQETKQPVATLLANQKILSSEAMAQAKAAFLNIPFISFKDKKVDQQYLDLMPADTYLFYKFFPFDRNGQNLKVAVLDPTNIAGLEALEFLAKKQGYNIQLYATDEESFEKVTDKQKNVTKVVGDALTELQEKENKEKTVKQQKQEVEEKRSDDLIATAPISKIVDVIITNAINANASDIHIEPVENELRIRYRTDGILHTVLVLPRNVQNAVISKIKILASLKIDESRLPQDGRFHYEAGEKAVDMRVSTLPNVNGEKIVLRLLDKSTRVPTLEELGYRGKALEWAQENIKKTHGIFLITGPTGSGKSTTLYSMLSILNKPTVNIVTLEDPVEYFMPGVNQSQINSDIGLTFSSGLRSILRQDPNIIMVGEIRDRETAELAVQAALTGHLVFSTLHTNNAIGAIPRLMDMGIETFLLIASLNAIGAQRLVRKICPDCKAEADVLPEVKKKIIEELKGVNPEELKDVDLKDIKLYTGKGCDKCGETGYKGRLAIVEMLPIVPKIQDLVLGKTPPASIYEEALKMGMISMTQDGIIKALQGLTTYEEIIRVTTE